MKGRRVIVFALLALATLLTGRAVLATGNLEVITLNGTAIGNRVWHNNSLPLVWRHHDPNTFATCNYSSTHAPANTLLAAEQAGFDAWQADPHSRIAFTYGGTTTTRSVANDGINIVTYCDATVLMAEQGFLASTPSTALTVPRNVVAGGGCPPGQGLMNPGNYCFPVGSYPAGTMIDADIRFNTFSTNENTDFSTDGFAGTSDIQATITHEIGHFFGLSHDPIPQAVMFPFIDDEPPSDGLGLRVLKRTDLSTSERFYPEPSFSTALGSITGLVTLDFLEADGVHVVAIDPSTMLGVAGRFSISFFEDPGALGPDGPDFAANGGGFYRIDGLPPGDYYVYVEYFTNSEFFSGRLANRYNSTVANSGVSNGNSTATGQATGAWLGFIPALAEFYNAADGNIGGDGISPGTATDNSDVATLVTVTAGAVTSNINIQVNLEPANGELPEERENPTTRTTVANDNFQGTDQITAFAWNGGGDDFYGIKYPAASLPAPPYNIAEGQWIRGGRTLQAMGAGLTFADPGNPNVPDLTRMVVPVSGRVLTGGPGGATAAGDFVDVRDQWNVTVNTARDVWIILTLPPSLAGLITEGYFPLVTRRVPQNTFRVGRSFITQNGGATWSQLPADVFYDLLVETAPPVMLTGASPSFIHEGQSADVDINGFGMQFGGMASFGPGVVVNSCNQISQNVLRCNITATFTGATADRLVPVKVTNPGAVFPNVAQIFTVRAAPDGDGDGSPDFNDCAPADPTLKSPAALLSGLVVTDQGASTLLSWTSQDPTAGSGTSYDIVTGLAGDLVPAGGYSGAVCAQNNHGNTPFVDLNAPPPPGGIRYWILRAVNGCTPGGGTYGDSTKVPDPRDALDAGTPCP